METYLKSKNTRMDSEPNITVDRFSELEEFQL